MSDVYRNIECKNAGDVMVLANWLRANGMAHAGQPRQIGVALHEPRRGKRSLAFATGNEVVSIDLKSETAALFLGGCLSVMVDNPQVELVMRDMFLDLQDLVKLLAKHSDKTERDIFERLSPMCVGDLRQAANICGFEAPSKGDFKVCADDAFEVALLEPQYAHGITAYYSKVALPFARLQAEGRLFATKESPDWWVSYPQLWLRVWAHFSSDPTLVWAFNEQRDVLSAVAEALQVTATQAQALLLWHAHGRDLQQLAKRFPEVIDDLPDSLPSWVNKIDRHYPVMVASMKQMEQSYIDKRAALTLYGRKLRPGFPTGAAVSHMVFGTVEDMVAVAAVSLWQNRMSSEIMVTSIRPNSPSMIRINGEGPSAGKPMWQQTVNGIAPLGNPMTVSLAPTVVFP